MCVVNSSKFYLNSNIIQHHHELGACFMTLGSHVVSFASRVANMEEANKLIGTGKKHLVTGKVVEAVSALQEACGVL